MFPAFLLIILGILLIVFGMFCLNRAFDSARGIAVEKRIKQCIGEIENVSFDGNGVTFTGKIDVYEQPLRDSLIEVDFKAMSIYSKHQ